MSNYNKKNIKRYKKKYKKKEVESTFKNVRVVLTLAKFFVLLSFSWAIFIACAIVSDPLESEGKRSPSLSTPPSSSPPSSSNTNTQIITNFVTNTTTNFITNYITNFNSNVVTNTITNIITNNVTNVVTNYVNNRDSTPPRWRSGYPKLTAINQTSVRVAGLLDEPGTIYYLVLDESVLHSISPSLVKNSSSIIYDPISGLWKKGGVGYGRTKGNGSFLGGRTVSSTEARGLLLGMVPGSRYKIYLVAKDTAGNIQTTVSEITFTTAP